MINGESGLGKGDDKACVKNACPIMQWEGNR